MSRAEKAPKVAVSAASQSPTLLNGRFSPGRLRLDGHDPLDASVNHQRSCSPRSVPGGYGWAPTADLGFWRVWRNRASHLRAVRDLNLTQHGPYQKTEPTSDPARPTNPGAAHDQLELDGAAKLGLLQSLHNLVLTTDCPSTQSLTPRPCGRPPPHRAPHMIMLKGFLQHGPGVVAPSPLPDRVITVTPYCTSQRQRPSSAIALGPSDRLVGRGRMYDLGQASRIRPIPLAPAYGLRSRGRDQARSRTHQLCSLPSCAS